MADVPADELIFGPDDADSNWTDREQARGYLSRCYRDVEISFPDAQDAGRRRALGRGIAPRDRDRRRRTDEVSTLTGTEIIDLLAHWV